MCFFHSMIVFCLLTGYNRVQIWQGSLCPSSCSFSCDLCPTWWNCDIRKIEERINGKSCELCDSSKILGQSNKIPYSAVWEVHHWWTSGTVKILSLKKLLPVLIWKYQGSGIRTDANICLFIKFIYKRLPANLFDMYNYSYLQCCLEM